MTDFASAPINASLAAMDPAIAGLIDQEQKRQETHLELIASENFASRAVMEAQGSVLTNKYAEGLPSKRYYGGCEHVDAIEELAIERAKELFGAACECAAPQWCSSQFRRVSGSAAAGRHDHGPRSLPWRTPHPWLSGQCQRQVVQRRPVRRRQGLPSSRHGGHRQLALEHKPKLIVCGYSAYPRIIDFAAFRAIADEVGAYLLADMAHIAGLVAAGVHPSPVPHCDVVTTTTHKTLRGPRGGLILCRDAEFAKKFDKAVFPGSQGGPLEHVIAAKAVAFGEALQPAFKQYSQQVVANAAALAERLVARGIDVVSGGTDNHVVLLDLRASA